MKKLVISCLAALMMMGAAITVPMAASAAITPTVDFDVTYNSKYVWRGMLLVDDSVIQPSVNVGVGNFSFNVWGNYEPTDETGHEKKFTEIDLTGEYDFSIGDFTIPVGIIHYVFPNTDVGATTELFAGVGYDWIVSPSVTLYYDADAAAGGLYVLFEAAYSYELPIKEVSASIDLGAGVAWANEDYIKGYYGIEDSAWSDWYASLAVPFGFLDGMLTVTPHVTYTALMDSDLKDTTEDDSNFYFGLSATLSF